MMNRLLVLLLFSIFSKAQEVEVSTELVISSSSGLDQSFENSVENNVSNDITGDITADVSAGLSTSSSILPGGAGSGGGLGQSNYPGLQVDCSSGAVDSATQLSTLTDAECISRCQSKCSHVATEEEADECLGEDELLGCLFDVQHLRMTKTEFCQTKNNTNPTSTITVPAIVYEIGSDDLVYYGDGNEVKEVWLSMNITDISILKNQCENSIKVGISLETFDQTTCLYHGLASSSQAFGLPEATTGTGTITTNVTDIISGTYGSTSSLPLFAEFTDPKCSDVKVEDVGLVFALSYKTGYRPSKTCSSVETCTGCMANGCTWCDWSGTVNTLLPGWLPDWDWIEDAREGKNGLCGINSAVCRASLGAVNKCGALSSKVLGYISFISFAVFYALS